MMSQEDRLNVASRERATEKYDKLRESLDNLKRNLQFDSSIASNAVEELNCPIKTSEKLNEIRRAKKLKGSYVRSG